MKTTVHHLQVQLALLDRPVVPLLLLGQPAERSVQFSQFHSGLTAQPSQAVIDHVHDFPDQLRLEYRLPNACRYDRFRQRAVHVARGRPPKPRQHPPRDTRELEELRRQLDRIEEKLDAISVAPEKTAHVLAQSILDRLGQQQSLSLERHTELCGRIGRLPVDLRREPGPWLSQISRGRTPMAAQQAGREILRRIGLRADTMIENGILAVITEHEQIGSSDLIMQARVRRVCQDASVFRLIKKLLAEKRIGRRNVGKDNSPTA